MHEHEHNTLLVYRGKEQSESGVNRDKYYEDVTIMDLEDAKNFNKKIIIVIL